MKNGRNAIVNETRYSGIALHCLKRQTFRRIVTASITTLFVSASNSTPAVANAANSAVASQISSLQHTLAAQPEAEQGQAVTELADGRWLLSGGSSASKVLAVLDSTTGRISTLPMGLAQGRKGHSATLLPDGTVFVFGGTDDAGSVLNTGELIDVSRQQVRAFGVLGLLPRAAHTATLLADGTVLLLGGRDGKGAGVADAELFDPLAQTTLKISTRLDPLRWGQVAALLPTSNVLLVGGINSTSPNVQTAQALDPIALRLTAVDDATASSLADSIIGTAPPVTVSTYPSSSASDFPVDGRIVIKLSKRMNVATLNQRTTTLVGPNGPINATVVGAERGLLLFITPTQELLPATHYSLFVKGATDELGQSLPMVSIGFSTGSLVAANARNPRGTSGVSAPAVSADLSSSSSTPTSSVSAAVPPTPASEAPVSDAELGQEDWTPETRHQHGNWRTGRHRSRYQSLPPLQAAGGVAALAGQVLKLNGTPLANVEVRSNGKSARTDATGRFLLKDLPTGATILEINTASDGAQSAYGYFSDRVVVKAGVTTPLAYTIWMTRLDTKHVANIASPTTQETVITNPVIPGLELHLPAGTVIKDRQGKIVTQLSITAIPVDRPPFPLPIGVNVPTYFTVQPGGATIENLNSRTPVGARLIYPNFTRQPPGSTVLFWDYDSTGKGWYVYGKGKVSVDGTQSIPDPGVEIYQFTGAMVGSPDMGPPNNPPSCSGGCVGSRSGRNGRNGFGGGGAGAGGGGGGAGGGGNGTNGNNGNNGSGGSGSGTDCLGGSGGDPVDCSTGIFMYHQLDLQMPDTVPIQVMRTYLSRDPVQRAFGIGATHDYDMFLVGDTDPWTYQDLILPRGGKIHFARTSSGTEFNDAIYVANSTPDGTFAGATLSWNSVAADWDLRTNDGSHYVFPEAEGNTIPSYSGLLSFADSNGNQVTIERNADNNNVSRVVSPNGKYITFLYDDQDRVTQIFDISGRKVSYAYDDVGRLSSVTNANGGVERYTYDDNNNMLSITDPRGILKLQNTYEPTYQGVSSQTLGDGGVFHFSYQFSSATGGNGAYPKHLSTTVTNPLGVVSLRTFDTNSSATTTQPGMDGDYVVQFDQAVGSPLQWTRLATRDTAHRITSFTDELGRVETTAYDSQGNVTRQTKLAGTSEAATTTFTYDGENNLVSATDPLGHTTKYTYNAAGMLTGWTDALNHTWSQTFDSQGNLISRTDPLGNVQNFTYSGGLLSQAVDPLGNSVTFARDNVGRISAITDPVGNVTKYLYDGTNNVITQIDALGHALSLVHDNDGNVTQVTTPGGLVYSYAYDNNNRKTKETDPAGKSQTWSYDLDGNVKSYVDRKNQTTAFTYNSLEQVIGHSYSDGSADSITSDAAGRLLSITKGSATSSFGYNGLNEIVSEQGQAAKVASAYDLLGRKTSLEIDGQPAISFSWDDANHISGVSEAAGTTNGGTIQSISYSWDAANRLSGRLLPNGIAEVRTRDAAGKLLQVTYSSSVGNLGSINYTYDADGRRVSQGGSLSTPTLPVPTTFTYDQGGRLASVSGTSVTSDFNGSVTADSNYSYQWDVQGRLVQLLTPAGQFVASFTYDPLGRRSSVMLPSDTSPRSFVYDGLNVDQERNGVQSGSGGTLVASYLNGLSVDENIARYTSQAIEIMLTDGLGSTVALTNTTGAITTQYAYDPYGTTQTTGNQSGNARQYTGRENDSTGLYYFRARFYNPATGRFISEDPLGWESGQINRYAYASGDPIDERDPLGLFVTVSGVEGGAYTGVGGGAGVGHYNSPDDPCATSGSFYNTASGYGYGQGASVYGGFYTGNVSGFMGASNFISIGVGPITGTVSWNGGGWGAQVGVSVGSPVGVNWGSSNTAELPFANSTTLR